MDIEKVRQEIYTALGRQDWAAARQYCAQLAEREPVEAAGLVVSSYVEAGDTTGAAAALVQLRSLAPQDLYTQFLTARVAFMQRRYVTARDLLQKLLAQPDVPDVYVEKLANLLGQCARELGDSETSVAAYRRAAEAATDAPTAALEYSNYLFNRHYLPQTDLAAEREAAAGFGQFFAHLQPLCPAVSYRDAAAASHLLSITAGSQQVGVAGRKLRIGFLSPDFRQHVVLCFSYVLVTHYDHEQFAVFAYMTGPEDAYSAQVAQRVDGWRNLQGLAPEAAARQIRADGIDILIDLAGHTRGNTLPILSWRPAPVQVSGIGYFASTGLAAVDYFLGDRYLDDKSTAAAFTETVLALPQSHFCYRPLQAVPVTTDIPWLRNGYITFGSFNNFTKVNDRVLACWRAILAAVPGSHLLLKASIFDSEEGRKEAEARLIAAGLDLARVERRGISRDYLREYGDLDIALDTFPYPGGGTSCDALYMGVPLVTLKGNTHGGRFGYSLLQNLGLGELCATSEAEYVARAVGLASDPGLVQALHTQLRPLMQRSPLMDAAAYSAATAAAWQTIWQRYQTQLQMQTRQSTTPQILQETKRQTQQPAVQEQAPTTVTQRSKSVRAGRQPVQAATAPPTYAERRQLQRQLAAYTAAGDWPQAMAVADRVLQGLPTTADYTGLREAAIVAYLDGGNIAAASAAARDLTATDACALYLKAECAGQSGDTQTAAALCAQALAQPGLEDWLRGALEHRRAETAKAEGDRATAAAAYLASSQAKTLAQGAAADYSNYLLSQQFLTLPPEQYRQAAAGYGRLFAPAQAPAPYRHAKLRIGYISPDLHRHIVAAFSQAFFQARDGVHFTTYAYSTTQEPDEVTAQIKQQADHWRDLAGLSWAEQAAQIRRDEIDILVELAGHTGDNALPVLALRPAPCQLCGIGYFATTGLPAVDGFLVDRYTAPAGEEAYFTERLLRLLHSHLCYTPLMLHAATSREAPCQRLGDVTLGSLNQLDKINADVLRTWARILQALPTARLLIKAGALNKPRRRAAFLAQAQAAGLDTARLSLQGYSEDYLAAYADIDIALDTFPYPGGGTTCDALAMGVPVVTLAGATHHQRFGASILANVGFNQGIAQDMDDYVQRTVALAIDQSALAELHHSLPERLQRSPVMDQQGYMRDLEHIYTLLAAHTEPAK